MRQFAFRCPSRRLTARLAGTVLSAIAVPAAADSELAAPTVFAPSKAPTVLSDEDEPPLFDVDITGREAGAFPRLEGAFSLEVQNDAIVKSEGRHHESNDLGFTSDLFIAARLTPELSLKSTLVAEDVRNNAPGNDQYLGGNGVFVETLGVIYETDRFSLFAGKFNPLFGVAWDLAPGIYGADLADGYELTERIGVGGSVTVEGDVIGEHILTAQTFFLDTSPLSGSVGEPRGRNREGDGGVSNTQSLQSFSVTLDGEVPGLGEVLRYQLGLERQKAGRSETRNEWGYAAALYGGFDVNAGDGPEIRFEPVIEAVAIRNQDGEATNAWYLTAGTGVFIGPWNVALSYTRLLTRPEDENSYRDHLFQVSAGYEFEFGVGVNLGYAYQTQDNAGEHIIGVLLTYDFDFSVH